MWTSTVTDMFRSEQGDSNNIKTGSYGYRDVNGLYRRVNYVADANGFRATVDTNEPGNCPRCQRRRCLQALHRSFHRFPQDLHRELYLQATRLELRTPYNAGGYNATEDTDTTPTQALLELPDTLPYGSIGYTAGGPALGGQAYGGSAPYGYGAAGFNGGYVPGAYASAAGYGGLPSSSPRLPPPSLMTPYGEP
ncbi:hypothetical protein HPB52_020759 [Rhipicephalus sanguineus]|uniref:Cuticle protein n=1 Tax=Rhipicephalus sanguineus TaxID=34632 RepID=A0A9D4Q2P5_RHISA|nr:hypothetical protein HPB52_020759 [Rhipicephalus sanguineus]